MHRMLPLFFLFAGVVASAAQTLEPSRTRVFFKSGDERIAMEQFEPVGAAKLPPVIVLHGAGGTIFDGPEMRRVAIALAASGHPAYLVHYFERTGTIFGLDAGMQKNFETWLATVRDAINSVQQRTGQSSRVGIYGYSLGGFLAIAAASNNARVGAVVEHAGGIWNGKTARIGRMPPVLCLHGRDDMRVPFAKYAEPLAAVLRARGAKVETDYFAGEGHAFSAAAMKRVREDAVAFFRRQLRD